MASLPTVANHVSSGWRFKASLPKDQSTVSSPSQKVPGGSSSSFHCSVYVFSLFFILIFLFSKTAISGSSDSNFIRLSEVL